MKANIRSRSRSCGFTLFEVMMGVFLFSLVMVSVFQLFSQSVLTAGRTLDLSRINQSMQYQMETLRCMPWDELQALAAGGTVIVSVDDQGIPTTGNSKVPFDWKAFKLEQRFALQKAGHYEVTLAATWANARGMTRTRQLKSWFSKDGLNDFYTRSTTD